MKQVAYIKQELSRNRGRLISVRENMSDSDSETMTRKNFVYLVTRVDAVPEQVPVPQIKIVKKVETGQRFEAFLFKVKGVIYIKKNRFIFQVRYCHTLGIKVFWRTHVLSSDKPAALA